MLVLLAMQVVEEMTQAESAMLSSAARPVLGDITPVNSSTPFAARGSRRPAAHSSAAPVLSPPKSTVQRLVAAAAQMGDLGQHRAVKKPRVDVTLAGITQRTTPACVYQLSRVLLDMLLYFREDGQALMSEKVRFDTSCCTPFLHVSSLVQSCLHAVCLRLL
jgi:hypothetical protein